MISKELLEKAIKEVEPQLIEIQQSQIRHSRTGTGLLPTYQSKKDYSNYKGVKPHWDLYDSGKFINSIIMKYSDDKIVFNATDSKSKYIADMLEKRGDSMDNAMTFDDESLELAKTIVIAEFTKMLTNYLLTNYKTILK